MTKMPRWKVRANGKTVGRPSKAERVLEALAEANEGKVRKLTAWAMRERYIYGRSLSQEEIDAKIEEVDNESA